MDHNLRFLIRAFAAVDIANIALPVDQIQSGSIAIVIKPPGNSPGYPGLQDIRFPDLPREKTPVNDCQFQSGPEPGRYCAIPAVNSTDGPHLQNNDLVSQISESERLINIDPDLISQLRRSYNNWQLWRIGNRSSPGRKS